MTSPKPSGFTVADEAKDRTLRQASLVRRQCPESMLLKLHLIRYFGDDEVEEGEEGGFQILLPPQRSTEYGILLHALPPAVRQVLFISAVFIRGQKRATPTLCFSFLFSFFLAFACLAQGKNQEPNFDIFISPQNLSLVLQNGMLYQSLCLV